MNRLWLLFGLAACSEPTATFDAAVEPDTSDESSDFIGTDPPDAYTCLGLQCRITCTNTASGTTISGHVLSPNGALPIYDAYVYVPNAPLDPLPDGPTCPCCGFKPAQPITAALTDPSGKFALHFAPSGPNIPVVVQLGKWRRVVNIPNVPDCVNTSIDIRLPKTTSEGNMPKIAVTTGGCDPLACILPKLGIDAGELGVDSNSSQRVRLYQGSGGDGPMGMKPASTLWSSVKELLQFDHVLLASECTAHDETKTNPSALESYAKFGGRVIATGSQATWMNAIASWKTTAAWGAAVNATSPFPFDVSFPRGKALRDWFGTPSLAIGSPEANVGALNVMSGRYRYVYSAAGATMMLGFDTPVGAKPSEVWGKVVYADMSTASGTVDASYPSGCNGALTDEEKAVAFFLFERPSCL